MSKRPGVFVEGISVLADARRSRFAFRSVRIACLGPRRKWGRNTYGTVLGGLFLIVAIIASRPALRASAMPPTTLVSEGFTADTTAPNAWYLLPGVCLTAGTATTPATSVPACGTNASRDAVGQGALQLTRAATNQGAFVVYRSALPTSNGLQITFTDCSFNGSTPGADGILLFLTDATKAMPTALGPLGGSLGYANGNGQPGLANAYLGIGFDEYGNFSSTAYNRKGGPGRIPETIALRGANSSGYQYLTGVTGANGAAASLPFTFDQPVKTRPPNAPTIRITLTPTGQFTAAIDRHNGVGFVTYLSRMTVGLAGQPAVPPSVYVGLTASSGGLYNQHQISGFTVTTLAPATIFAPTQVPNLAAWYDGADPTSIVAAAAFLSAWNDKSGNANTLQQANSANQPQLAPSGINGSASIAFNGSAFLMGTDPAFSGKLFNESTAFIVTSQSSSAHDSLLASTGLYGSDPHWSLGFMQSGATNFDFGAAANRTSAVATVNLPTIWTAAGSVSTDQQYLRKNGNLLGGGSGPSTKSNGAYPLVLGATAAAGGVADPYTGQLGELIIYNRFLAGSETAQVEGYLACKWGLQARLPANHPYRYACPQAGLGGSPIPAPPPADTLPAPPELRSQNGSLIFNVAAQSNATTGNPQLTYNNSNVPPTLRVLPGDTLSVNVTNALPAPPSGATYMNDVSLHYHGLHVTPVAPGDDSIDMIAAPGQTLHYQFTIPQNQSPGLYWYHTHAHGETERQTLAGMSGALIVDGITQYVPQVANMPERVLVVRDAPLPGQPLVQGNADQTRAMRWSMQHGAAFGPTAMMNHMHMEIRARMSSAARNPFVLVNPKFRQFHKPQTTSTHCTGSETPVRSLTLNGQVQPTIGIRAGEQQFWRMVNAGADTYLDVAIDNAQLQVVAIDGVPVSSGLGTPSVVTISDYVLPPSSRVEFIVTGPPAGTPAFLRTNCFDAGPSGSAMPSTTLAAINSSASSVDLAKRYAATRPHQRVGKNRLPPLRTVRAIKAQIVARSQTLYYSDQNTINGSAYDPGAPPAFYAQSGTVEEWTIVNNAAQVHTFHIHQIHFVLEAMNGTTLAQQFVMDNVNVPAATASGPGSVKILLDFTDPLEIGTFLLHCHILSHEDGGMMAKIRVGTAPPLVLSTSTISLPSSTAPAQNVTVSGGQAPFSVNGCAKVANAAVNGSTITIAPIAPGACVLGISDSTGLLNNVAVSVAGSGPVVGLMPNAVSFTGIGVANQAVAISGGTLPYSASGCSGIVTAVVSGSVLTVTPTGVGSCSLVVSDSAGNAASQSVSVNAGAGANPLDNLTFHHDAMRTGWYNAETALTPATVAAANFGLLATLAAPAGLPAFGKVYAQPLYVSTETVADGSQHNLVIVATSTDQIYAFDDRTRAVVWHRDFTNPGAGITQQSWSDTNCADVNPNIGITGTPVIDRYRDALYVVVATKENGNSHLRLHAISLKSGFEATDANHNQVGPTEVTASYALTTGGVASVDARWNHQRSALLEANGNIYVALASHCDYRTSTTHGWMLAYSASSLAASGNMLDLTNANSGSTYFLGSPWMGGYGPAGDASGNVYFATGNGPFDGVSDFSMSIMRLPGTLDITKAQFFSPIGGNADSASDQDLGSGGVMLLPDLPGTFAHVAVAGGKCGVGIANGGSAGCIKYLLNRDNMGGKQTGDAGALFHADTGGGIWGGPAYFADSAGIGHIVYGTGSPLNTYTINLSPVSLSLQSSANVGCLECRDKGSQPVVSSNGTQAQTAVVWALKTPGNSGGAITLYGFDALNMSHTLFIGTAGGWTQAAGSAYIGGALISPVVANGNVYVPTDGGVAVFGLR